MRLILTIPVAGLLVLPAAAQEKNAVTGTATYRERVALPPTAVFEAALIDISKVDAQAETIGQAQIDHPGQPPFRFSISYDPARINAARSYAVRASIKVDGKLMFTTDQYYAVLTQGHVDSVAILMRRVSAAASEGSLGSLPASFSGQIPCADCPGIRYDLNLFPDRAYYSRMTYLERPGPPYEEIGRWVLSNGGTRLTLMHGARTSDQFAVKGGGVLRKLDVQGKEIQSQANYDLHRTAPFERLEPTVEMRGMFSYMADAASFTECETGQRWPVAMEADYPAIERAYTGAPKQSGQALLAGITGKVELRRALEGGRQIPTLIVEKFGALRPGESCGAPLATARLQETYWKLTGLNGKAVAVAEHQREAQLVLHTAQNRVTGSGGCNNFTGSYQLDGNKLKFAGVAATMMACLAGMEQESEFLKTLDRVRSYKITGELLELFDEDGVVLARFQAVALR